MDLKTMQDKITINYYEQLKSNSDEFIIEMMNTLLNRHVAELAKDVEFPLEMTLFPRSTIPKSTQIFFKNVQKAKGMSTKFPEKKIILKNVEELLKQINPVLYKVVKDKKIDIYKNLKYNKSGIEPFMPKKSRQAKINLEENKLVINYYEQLLKDNSYDIIEMMNALLNRYVAELAKDVEFPFEIIVFPRSTIPKSTQTFFKNVQKAKGLSTEYPKKKLILNNAKELLKQINPVLYKVVKDKKIDIYKNLKFDKTLYGIEPFMSKKPGAKKKKSRHSDEKKSESKKSQILDFSLPEYDLYGGAEEKKIYYFDKSAKEELDIFFNKFIPFVLKNYEKMTESRESYIKELVEAGKLENKNKTLPSVSQNPLGHYVTGMVDYIIDILRFVSGAGLIKVNKKGENEKKFAVTREGIISDQFYQQLNKYMSKI